MKYTVKKGDNLIKILRNAGLTQSGMLNEVIKRNGIKDTNLTHIGQVLDLPDAEFYDSIAPAGIVARKQDYSQTPVAQLPNTRDVDENGNMIPGYADRVNAYAQAIRDRALTVNQVPEQYRQQAYNASIRNTMDEAAPYVMKYVLGAPWSIVDTAVRSGLSEGRKLISRAQGNDTSNDYGVGDYFENFSWTGKQFEAEHPYLAFAADALATPTVMVGAENLGARAMDGALSNTGREAFQNAAGTAEAMGVNRMTPSQSTVNRTAAIAASERQAANAAHVAPRGSGHVYKGPGAGKNTSAGRINQGWYYPTSRVAPESNAQFVDPGTFKGTGYWHGLYMPMQEPERTNYVVAEPEVTHIEEQKPTLSRWVTTTDYDGPRVPYRPEYEDAEYIEAQAPRGKSVKEQPITKESLKKKKGLVKQSAQEVSGPVEGSTPSGYYSGYGFTYGPEGGV